MRSLPILITLGALVAPAAAMAQDRFSCRGKAPDWALQVDEATAQFRFLSETDMDVALSTNAEGQDWPRALTLIGDRDTAIVVIERETCSETAPYRAHVMTQRGQTPILLTGCCEPSE